MHSIKLEVDVAILSFLLLVSSTFAQDLSVSGVIKDSNTDQGIYGANICVKGTRLCTTSDLEGRYTLSIRDPDRRTTIVFEHVAYETREVSIDSLLFERKVHLRPLSSPPSSAQWPQYTVSGIIRDMNTHREIQGVNIHVKGTKIGTFSDFAGRYSLRVSYAVGKPVVVFRHVAYEEREIELGSLATMRFVDMQARIIPLQGIEVEAEAVRRSEIEKDLPQTLAVVEAKNFEIRGYADAGDLLRTDHSVQVDEEVSGKKTVGIRAGNADEVLVLYNGIKLNNAYNNLFDFSLIDVEDIERFEIIKGSNTALYGPEAFAGVINIVPKVQQDYNVRFQQRLGTYRSGNWGVHLYKDLDRFYGAYSFRRGGAKRDFRDVIDENSGIENTSTHHTASAGYTLSTHDDGRPASALDAMYVRSSLEYDNRRGLLREGLSNSHDLASLKYTGHLFKLRDLNLSLAARRLNEDQRSGSVMQVLHRRIDDRAFDANIEKRVNLLRAEVLLAYQFQKSDLDLTDDIQSLGATTLARKHHGLAAIGKWHGSAGPGFLNVFDLNVSVRHDRLHDDRQGDGTGAASRNEWNETMFKLGANLSGRRHDLSTNLYLNIGNNTKFPTLFQQISTPAPEFQPLNRPRLTPEKNNSLEVGFTVTRDLQSSSGPDGWQLSGTYFQNHYDNKFRVFYVADDPRTFYDNVPNARISGFEIKPALFFFRKKATVDLGLSRYNISEMAAFPFKSDFKLTVNFLVDHAGYSFQVHWFNEGEQTAWIRPAGQEFFSETTLPAYANLDVHLSKEFALSKFRLFANASGRNLLNDDEVVLQGLAIRDRRFYLTIGAEY